MEHMDTIVVGAGWAGLAAAKTYLELHPDEDVVVLEAAESVGGVWAQHRLYPGLKSNNMFGTYQYPDYPMDGVKYGLKQGEHIPGTVLHQYLTDFAKHFGFFDRIRLGTKVATIESTANGTWILKTGGSKPRAWQTRRLIMATGLTSEPYMPNIPGAETFKAPLFHAKDFQKHAGTLSTAKNVVVLGGAKSAFDVSYAYASKGVQVDMIIRKSGHGPVWMAPAYVTPLKKWLEKLVHTRSLTFMSPCVWGDEDGYGWTRANLHNTWLGQAAVNKFWNILGSDVITLNKYDSHPELKKLKPWDPAFYVGASLSIHNYPTSFFDLVREGKVRVHIDEVVRLDQSEVYLESGEALKADVFVSATGWKNEPSIQFLGAAREKVGLHGSPADLEALAAKADDEILARFPRLRTQPARRKQLEKATAERMRDTLRMYRFMVPPLMAKERNIAFVGMCMSVSTTIVATVQALWVSAFFDGKLDRLPSAQSEVMWQTMLHTQFCKWRYPIGYGPRFPDFVFDGLPYIDMLLKDLGINNYRKGGGIAELGSPYGAEDYQGITHEWQESHGGSASHVTR